MGRICAFFGHRDIWQDISEPLEQAIRTVIKEHDISVFWVGGYGQFDSRAAGMVRGLKKEFPNITLHLVLSYLPTAKTYFSDNYDSTVYPEGLELVPRRYAISKRNQWIVNNCDIVIAYVHHNYGGAYTACKYAERKGKLIINIGQ